MKFWKREEVEPNKEIEWLKLSIKELEKINEEYRKENRNLRIKLGREENKVKKWEVFLKDANKRN